jgi:hypothetical protein
VNHSSPTVVDFKVKNSPISQDRADSDSQAGLYLAGRWLEEYPASELCFAQIAKPGKRRKQMSASLVRTTRSPGQLRGVLARLALAASQITACYERYGPDQPWGFADPTSWKCSPRYCSHWRTARADVGSSKRVASRHVGCAASGGRFRGELCRACRLHQRWGPTSSWFGSCPRWP